jgi:hypothetical protein
VNQQSARGGLKQKILGTAFDRIYHLTLQAKRQLLWNQPAQPRFSHHEALHPHPAAVWRHPPAGGLDFRQFRHEIAFQALAQAWPGALRALGQKAKNPGQAGVSAVLQGLATT